MKNKIINKTKTSTVKIYNAVFNSKFTAFVALTIMSGLSYKGILSLVGENQVCVVISTIAVILLASKVVNKLIKQ